MKKFLYSLLICFAVATTITACTDEEITPQTELKSGGGHAMADKGM